MNVLWKGAAMSHDESLSWGYLNVLFGRVMRRLSSGQIDYPTVESALRALLGEEVPEE